MEGVEKPNDQAKCQMAEAEPAASPAVVSHHGCVNSHAPGFPAIREQR